MAGNRPLRPGMAQDSFKIREGRGHEFQNDVAHDLPLSALAQTPRNIFKKSIRRYRDVTASDTRANFTQLIFPYAAVFQLILPQAARGYLLIQNLDAAANLFVGFGFQPTTTQGLKIIPGTAYEPYVVPQNDIFICGDAAGTCMVLFSAISSIG